MITACGMFKVIFLWVSDYVIKIIDIRSEVHVVFDRFCMNLQTFVV